MTTTIQNHSSTNLMLRTLDEATRSNELYLPLKFSLIHLYRYFKENVYYLNRLLLALNALRK